MPDSGYEEAWKHLIDREGFYSPYGPTFLEQRHPEFKFLMKVMNVNGTVQVGLLQLVMC